MLRASRCCVSLALLMTAIACSDDEEPGGSPGGAAGGGSSGTSTGGTSGSAAGGKGGTSGAGASGGTSAGASGTSAGKGGSAGLANGGTSGSDAGGGGESDGGESSGVNGGAAGSSEGGSAGGRGGPEVDPPPSCAAPAWDAADFATVYDVGPGQTYETPSDVPWESIAPDTLVRIHRRDTPYTDKWVISVAASEDAPVVVLGVPDESGLLPEIRGDGAVTRDGLNYWSETRGIIKIGGSSVPDLEIAQHVVVECLDIAGARAANTFTDDSGTSVNYDDNASAIFLEAGANVTLRNNRFHDCGNGLFVASQSSSVLVSGNQIFDNGNVDSIYEHNSYTEAHGITFEFNHYGALCEGCPGNNLKDRSSGLVVRYNWIEGGNRTLDLVDSEYDTIYGAPDYDDTFVYGNVLVELDDDGNRQIIHYGGDNSEELFRTGTLHFFHNTVVSERSTLATLVRLSSPDASIDARNNVFYALAGGDRLAVLEDAGTAVLAGNFLPTGYLEGSPSLSGTVTATDNTEGGEPGFADAAGRDYALSATSPACGATVPLSAAAAAHPVSFEFAAPSGGAARSATDCAGAFE